MKTPAQLAKYLAGRPWYVWVSVISGLLAGYLTDPVAFVTGLI